MVMALLAWTGGMLFSTPPSSEETSKTDLLAMLEGFRSLCDHDQLIQGLRVSYITKFPKFKKNIINERNLGRFIYTLFIILINLF